jgi:hypothetical protein
MDMAGDRPMDHLLRRAGFGAGPADLAIYGEMSTGMAIDRLLNYESLPDTVDSKIGLPEYVSVTAGRGAFTPNTRINDARQRWLFRMVHFERPLQEKMALF